MYKKDETCTIAKKRYSFKKGYLQVAIGDIKEIQKKLMELLGATRLTYFSTLLNRGIVDMSKAKYDAITALFNQYSIIDIWDIKE